MKFGGKEKKYAPSIIFHSYVEHLRKWIHDKQKSLLFAIPMVWREPASQYDCYFCYQLRRCMGYFKGVSQKILGNYKDPN